MVALLKDKTDRDVSIAVGFRTLMHTELPALIQIGDLPDTLAENILLTPSVIQRWLNGVAPMPQEAEALRYDAGMWTEIQRVCEEALQNEFTEAWSWLRDAPASVQEFWHPARRVRAARILLTWWRSAAKVSAVIAQASTNPYVLMTVAMGEFDAKPRQLYEICTQSAPADLPWISRARGAVLAAVAKRNHQHRLPFVLRGDKGEAGPILKEAARLLAPHDAEKMAKELVGLIFDLLPCSKLQRADQEGPEEDVGKDQQEDQAEKPTSVSGTVVARFAEWPVDLHLMLRTRDKMLSGVPSWFHWARAGAANRIWARYTTPATAVDPGILAEIDEAKVKDGHDLAPEQRVALRHAFTDALSIVTGGPGTGKTALCQALTTVAANHGMIVRGFAPTGRAARRLQEMTGIPSATIHSTLMTGGYTRKGSMPPCHIAVIDECSMLDTRTLAAVLLASEGVTPHLVLLGDRDQLPPVEGTDSWISLLSVLQHYGGPVTTLRHTFRHDPITLNARWLFDGKKTPWVPSDTVVALPLPSDDEDALARTVEAWLDERPSRDVATDWQVIAYMKDTTKALNGIIRHHLLKANGDGWVVGDRVMQTVNDYDVDLRNGEQGLITKVTARKVTARFGERQVAVAPAYTLGNWTHAWAITAHKSQGGEWHDILVVATDLNESHNWSREALYTAITRVSDGTVSILAPDPVAVVTRAKATPAQRTRSFSYETYLDAMFRRNLGLPAPRPATPKKKTLQRSAPVQEAEVASTT